MSEKKAEQKEIKVEKTENKVVKEKTHSKKEATHTEHKKPNHKHFEHRERVHVESTKDDNKEKPVFVKKQSPFKDYKLFNKWSFNDVIVSDLSLINYINLDPVIVPHSFGTKSQKKFGKANINIVERLINKAMRSGQGKRKLSGKFIRGRNGCGKKLQVMNIVEDAFTQVEQQTKQNPIQVLVTAIENTAPREDVTRVKKGGVAYSLAVDVSPMKRLDEAVKNIALAGFGNSYKSTTDASKALANEIVAAAANDQKSLGIKRRDEVERIAKASR